MFQGNPALVAKPKCSLVVEARVGGDWYQAGGMLWCIILSEREPFFNGTLIHLRMRKKKTQRRLRSSNLSDGRRYKSMWCHRNPEKGQACKEGWL